MPRLIQAVVTGLGIGYLPLAPGTWASGTTVLLIALIHWAVPTQVGLILGGLLLFITPVAVIFSTRFSKAESHTDPSEVVIDEIIGQMICFLWNPVSMVSLMAGFLMFRFFDIVKPFPVRTCERLPGGMGIVFDDVAAGLYAGVLLAILLWLLPG
ncbi:MAG: phosphatidylglycerophosphatase A [Acidobacteriota bacterium]